MVFLLIVLAYVTQTGRVIEGMNDATLVGFSREYASELAVSKGRKKGSRRQLEALRQLTTAVEDVDDLNTRAGLTEAEDGFAGKVSESL